MADQEDAEKWAFIFQQFGKDTLQKMLLKAAVKKNEEGRVVIEFDGDKAMDITDHVEEMESKL
jgi:hypothetical protein